MNPWNRYLRQRDSSLSWESSTLWKHALPLNSVILILIACTSDTHKNC